MSSQPTSDSDAQTNVHPERSRPRFSRLRTSAAVVGAVLGGVVVLLAVSTLFPASTNIVTILGALVWPNFAPQLVLMTVFAALLCVPLWLARRRPVLRGIASGLVVVGLVTSSVITGIMVNTANQNGGSVNLARATTLSTPDAGPTTIASYVTVDGEKQQARVFEPAGGAKGAPVMMYIHGGGWYMGSAAALDPTAAWYASQGWYVVNVNYRLASATNATWDKAPEDVACALAWTAQRASAAGADADRLTVAGDSAGGHLAMLLGWSAADHAAASSCPELGKVPVPDAVVAGFPVSNIDYTYDHGAAPIPEVDPQVFTRYFLGGAPSTVPERTAAVSPLTYVSDATPSTLVLQPERDDFIPAEGNRRVIKKAQDTEVDATLVTVPFGWHGFDSAPGSVGGQITTSVAKAWLTERGLAP